jgi:hypothetical protein
MNRGPIAGRNPVEQSMIVARAFMAVGADVVDEAVEGERRMIEWAGEHGPVTNKWVRLRRSGRPDRYMRGNLTSGENTETLPAGAEVVLTMEETGSHRLRTEFAQFVSRYVSGDFGPPDPYVADSFRMTLEACAPNFRETVTGRIAASLFREGGFQEHPEGKPAVLNIRVIASGVNSQIRRLQDRYARYGVDSWLLGNLETARDICEGAARTQTNDTTLWPFDVAQFFVEAYPEPYDLVARIVTRAVKLGTLEAILAIGETRRDELDTAIDAARNADDVDAMLDSIYMAVPAANACYTIYRLLSTAPETVGTDTQRRVWSQVFKLVFEKRSRMLHSIISSVQDIGGFKWARAKHEIAGAREAGGQDGAEAHARLLVDEHMIYPRASLPALLAVD